MNEQIKAILEQQLRDVHAPEAVTWWPLAVGWWILIALLAGILVLSLFKAFKHRRRNLYRKAAIVEVDNAFVAWQKNQLSGNYIQAANTALKRAFLHIDTEAKSSSGRRWIAHLNASSKTELSAGTALALSELLYHEQPNIDVERIHPEIRAWLKNHKSKSAFQAQQAGEQTHA